MIEFTQRHFDDLCRDSTVRTEIGAIEEKRRSGLRRFWLLLAGSIALAIAIGWSLIVYDWPTMGIILAFAVLIGGVILALAPLSAAKQGLKLPVLETLARHGGMEYVSGGFDPPVFAEAGRTLFGAITGSSFTDLFHGTDENGQRFAIYEGNLTRRAGKNTVTVFTGQLYAFQRRSRGGAEIAIVPDKGLFNFLKPSGMARVKFETDPDFEKKFEVYAAEPTAAAMAVGGDVRRRLLELRQQGRVFAWVGPEDVLVATWGKDRFEPGSMFRARSGEERVKLMFDDVCASLTVLRGLKSVLD